MTQPHTTTTGGQPLEASALETPPIHIPNGKGGAFKTELVLIRSKERTEKILWWHEDDPRPEPHNHPWDFHSEIISGGYTETRYILLDNATVEAETITYRQGDINELPTDVYHVVTDVQPNTTTRLTCGRASEGNEWGYIDIATGVHTSARDPKFKMADFLDRLREINPHMR